MAKVPASYPVRVVFVAAPSELDERERVDEDFGREFRQELQQLRDDLTEASRGEAAPAGSANCARVGLFIRRRDPPPRRNG